MAHQFTIKTTIEGVSIDEFKRLTHDISLHEAVCHRLPAQNLDILVSEKQGHVYTMKRAYNLDVNIPEVAKKLLKDAFRLQRSDVTDLQEMTSVVELGANLPIEARCQRFVTGDDKQIQFQLDWTVKVKVPLLGGMLEKHAEGEIRKFSEIEIDLVEDELRKNLSA